MLDLLADYFRYYQPESKTTSAATPALQLTLEFCETLPGRESLLPDKARLFSHTGALRLWHTAVTEGGEASQFYFDAGVAAFHLDTAAGCGTGYITPAALEIPRILANTYTLFPLLLLLRARGVYHLHAAAVLSPAGQLCLFPGSPRAGKTTLTTALGLAGWQPLADDSLLLDTQGGALRCWPLRKEFHVDEQLLARWPQLAAASVRHRYLGRACVGALEFFGTEELAQQPFAKVAAIVLPQITELAHSRLESVPASAALLKLAEQSVYLQLWRAHTARQFAGLAQLMQNARAFRFHSGRDLWQEPQVAAAVLCVEMAAERVAGLG
ncbi:MAG: hypothetical protein HYR56_23545 [Acidobacteria bacterium]|nr:hypothetical protein [Acidobacteriota bacterium]MBI3426263.1 hypothetical protein [Acidobacteriota bacterium]